LNDKSVNSVQYQSGIVTLWSAGCTATEFAKCLGAAADKTPLSLAIIWYSDPKLSAESLISAISTHAPELAWCGCSTSGEITPDGLQDDGLIALLLPEQWFTTSVTVFKQVDTLGMEAIAHAAEAACQAFPYVSDDRSRMLAINLIDGLSYSEEAVTVALDSALAGIPLIGGSAGDNLKFVKTTQVANGHAYTDSAVLILIETALPFELFTNDNFVPTGEKLVVTESDPDRRIVHEFNGEPAAIAYARALGLRSDELTFELFASNAVVLRIGGQNYCRAIQQINPDRSLTFLCAIDNGLVLTVSRAEGMTRSTQSTFDSLEAQLGPIDVMFGFDCIYRRLDAAHRGATDRIVSLYRERHFLGMNAYGEQYKSMHINQTLTGVAFGLPSAI